ncbi:YkyB family protein [Pseudalkalibacillus caeni]|uniref:YkyB family protein n=1 Tax=Exobacillus caeni TaxID=2574798 RepID=UPI0014859A69|nr:YkyB family protein [Pseudalkalibacillus caeni]
MNEKQIETIAVALYTVNKHAKVASKESQLYLLKNNALNKLLREGIAKKIGIHKATSAKYSKQQLELLIQIGRFTFHQKPTKHDLKNFPHLGERDEGIRNPKIHMPLKKARQTLEQYAGRVKQPELKKKKDDSKLSLWERNKKAQEKIGLGSW